MFADMEIKQADGSCKRYGDLTPMEKLKARQKLKDEQIKYSMLDCEVCSCIECKLQCNRHIAMRR